jgi:hypothetical protein
VHWQCTGMHAPAPQLSSPSKRDTKGPAIKFWLPAWVAGRVFSVKTQADSSQPGQVVETVTRKRIVAADPTGKERTTPDFWTYLESLKPPDWERHMLYIYRKDAETGPSIQLEKCVGQIVMNDGSRLALTDREETEHAIVQKYGGGTYRLILKRGSERITETRVYGEGPRKQPTPSSEYGGPQVTTMSEASATADVAKSAISTMAGQERMAVDVGVNALRSAAEVIQRFSQAPAASENDQMFKALMLRMMERMLAPPPDPIEMLTKLFALQASMGSNGGSAGGSPNAMVNKILETGLERVLNPSPAGPVSSASAELVRQLPQVAGYVTQAISEWRVGVEAQRETAAIMAGATKSPGAPAQPRPSPTILPPPGAPAPQPSPEAAVGTPSLEFIESRIVGILREPVAADEAAERTLEFLDTVDSTLVDRLKQLGEKGLMTLFQTRPVLRPAATNVPRLQEFITAFLKFANEGEEPKPPAVH